MLNLRCKYVNPVIASIIEDSKNEYSFKKKFINDFENMTLNDVKCTTKMTMVEEIEELIIFIKFNEKIIREEKNSRAIVKVESFKMNCQNVGKTLKITHKIRRIKKDDALAFKIALNPQKYFEKTIEHRLFRNSLLDKLIPKQ